MPEDPNEIVIASKALAPRQMDILREMLLNASPKDVLPDGCNAEHFWERLDVLSAALSGAEILSVRLRPLLGRALIFAQANPEYYIARGYESFEQFVKSLKIKGFSRSTAFHAKNFGRSLASLTPDEFEALGTERARTLVAFTDDSKPSFREHYDRALSMTVDEFKRDSEKRGLINPGETDRNTIIINTTREIKEQVDEWFTGILAQNKCGTADHGVILLHTIQEASSSWQNKDLDLLIFNPVVREALEAFVNDYRIHGLFGTKDKDTLLLGALAKVMNLVTEREGDVIDI
jgi:hypothetical protein